MAVLVFLVFIALVAFAVKRWFPGRVWFLKDHSKKEEKGADKHQLEIVVDKQATQKSKHAADKARKPLLSKPPRHEEEEPAKEGSMEGSIRTALNELRSRQYVKSICSKFEARTKRQAIVSDDDEESCIRAVNDGDEYVQPEQSQQSRREEPRAAPAPFVRRNSTAGKKPNNLNAFLRRYSSNLDRANFAEASDSSATPEPEPVADVAPAVVAVPVATPVAASPAAPLFMSIPVASGKRSGLFEISKCIAVFAAIALQSFHSNTYRSCLCADLDLQPATDADSNQCDSPVHDDEQSGSRPLVAPAMSDCEQPHEDEPADFDVTTSVAVKQQAPEEECSAGDKRVRPVASNSVARFQQFQQQFPSNHAARTQH